MSKFIDLTGKKIGKWTVIEFSHFNKKGAALFKCKYECGVIKNVCGQNLRFGRSKSCRNCSVKKLCKGKKYNHLTFVEYLIDKFSIWKCECGVVCKKHTNSVVGGDTKCCGSYCKKFGRARNGLGIKNSRFKQHKHNAEKRNIINYLTQEQWLTIVNKHCVYCGSIDYKKNSYTGEVIKLNGVDRKNNEKYYKLSNSLPCCNTCNVAKMEMTYKQFTQHIKKIYNYISK